MQRFADVTNKLILEGNLQRAEKCFRIADTLLRTGNLIIKNAVANVFVYSLSLVLDRRDEHYEKIMRILPLSLKEEYKQQQMSYGV